MEKTPSKGCSEDGRVAHLSRSDRWGRDSLADQAQHTSGSAGGAPSRPGTGAGASEPHTLPHNSAPSLKPPIRNPQSSIVSRQPPPPYHLVTLSLCHLVTLLRCYLVTLSDSAVVHCRVHRLLAGATQGRPVRGPAATSGTETRRNIGRDRGRRLRFTGKMPVPHVGRGDPTLHSSGTEPGRYVGRGDPTLLDRPEAGPPYPCLTGWKPIPHGTTDDPSPATVPPRRRYRRWRTWR